MKQEDLEFKANPSYIVRPCLRKRREEKVASLSVF
jgi:hypothetical protein